MSLLDDLDGSIEEEKQLARKKDEGFQGMLDNIEEEFESFKEWFRTERHRRICVLQEGSKLKENLYLKSIKKKPDFFVIPEAIEIFLKKQSSNLVFSRCCIAEYSAMLIQNSYDLGCNDFNVPVLKYKAGDSIDSLYSYLIGKKEGPINLTIVGDYAHFYCKKLSYANIIFKNSYSTWGASECENSKIIFEKNASHNCAFGLINCDAYFYDALGDGVGKYSKNTCFYSPHKKNLKQISKEHGLKDCSFYLLDEHDKPTRIIF